jgi:hypothetical protein
MNKSRFTIHVLAIATLTLAFASIAQAQASRTWVSGVGDDVNPCSRVAPCKTWAGAISKTMAGGEIDAMDPGGFGAVTLTKAVTLDGGEGQVAGVLVTGTDAIIVAAGTGDVVTLRNLDINGINGLGHTGILITGGKGVHIDHCQIYGFSQGAISDTRTAPSTPLLFVNDCFIRNNSSGIAMTGLSAGAGRAFIDHCRIQDNTGFGVGGSNNNVVTVGNSQINGNGGEGVRIDSSAQANVISSVLHNNLTGALNSGGLFFLLTDSTVVNNVTGVSGAITTFGNNVVRDNSGGNLLPAPVALQ